MEPQWSIRKYQGKFCIFVRIRNDWPVRGTFIWRFGYDDHLQASKVLDNLKENFGSPVGIESDLAWNYWRFDKRCLVKSVNRRGGVRHIVIQAHV